MKINDNDKQSERIAKRIARAGVCSRREAERLIESGLVVVNGKKIDSPALNVNEKDIIIVDGKPLEEKEPTRLWIYHKPQGLVTTHSDPENRPTVFQNLPKDIGRVISIGRLDLNSEGLLLLTNDGELARLFELPRTGLERIYRARAFGSITQEKLNKLQDGIVVEGVKYGAIDAILERDETKNAWIRVALREGKNREIRKVLAALGLKVNRLIRLSYGDFELGNLERGEIYEVPQQKLKKVINKLNQALKENPPKEFPPRDLATKPARSKKSEFRSKASKASPYKSDFKSPEAKPLASRALAPKASLPKGSPKSDGNQKRTNSSKPRYKTTKTTPPK